MNDENTVGVVRLKREDDDEPVGAYSVHYLRELLELAEAMNIEFCWLWPCRVEESGAPVLTETHDGEVGIAVAGCVEEIQRDLEGEDDAP